MKVIHISFSVTDEQKKNDIPESYEECSESNDSDLQDRFSYSV